MRSVVPSRGYGLLSLLILILVVSSHQIPQEEVDWLVQLYTNCNGPNWTDISNWNTFPTGTDSVCEWDGVICGQEHVSGLSLSGKNLTGCQIPDAISNVTRLSALDLSFNEIRGPLPHGLWTLNLLRTLSLAHNPLLEHSFDNHTDLSELKEIEQFKMNDMRLSGSLPASLFRHSTLKYVYVQNNQLTSLSWSDSSVLENIVDLDARNNLFESVPDQAFRLRDCQLLDLSHNRIDEFLPIGLTQLFNAEEIYLNNNKFTGNLHDFSSLTKLVVMDLSNNALFGAMPKWLPQVSYTLNLANNTFDCPLPEFASKFLVTECVDRVNLPLIFIFAAFGALVLVIIIGGIVFAMRRRRKAKKNASAALLVNDEVAYSRLEDSQEQLKTVA